MDNSFQSLKGIIGYCNNDLTGEWEGFDLFQSLKGIIGYCNGSDSLIKLTLFGFNP